MKTTCTYTLDVEIVEKLNNEDNRSGLINDLLTRHYQNRGTLAKEYLENALLENKKTVLEIDGKSNEYKARLVDVNRDLKRKEDLLESLPLIFKDLFLNFSELSIDALRSRHRDNPCGLKWPVLLDKFKRYFDK